MDGILQTHGKTLAGVGAILILVVAMVGEEDSPGVLSKVQEQAEAKKASGTMPNTAWYSPDPPPPPASGELVGGFMKSFSSAHALPRLSSVGPLITTDFEGSSKVRLTVELAPEPPPSELLLPLAIPECCQQKIR